MNGVAKKARYRSVAIREHGGENNVSVAKQASKEH